MNTQVQNIITTISRIALGVSLVILLILGASSKALPNNGNNNEEKTTLSVEDSLMVEQILVDLDAYDLDMYAIDVLQSKKMVEVYDNNDQLVFSGSSEEWAGVKNPDLVTLKRKADFLFESDNTQVFKVF